MSNEEQIEAPFAAVLTGGIVELTVGLNSTKLIVHRHILQKLPYFSELLKDNVTTEIVLPDLSEFAAATAMHFLYGAVANPFTALPNTLSSKIAVAQTFIVADRLGIPELADMAASKLSTIQLEPAKQLDFWKFVYAHTTKESRIRIPKSPGLSAKWFVTGLEEIGRVDELDDCLHELVKDLLVLAVHEN